jgi:predicted DNA-binding protein with PD1-like motif
MQSKLLDDHAGLKTYVLVFDKDDDVHRRLSEFASEGAITAASILAIGAFRTVTLGYFSRAMKTYIRIPVDEQVEVLSFVGNIVRVDGEPKVHAHVVVGKSDGTAHGGHFLDGRVWPTLEMVVTETPAHLRRIYDRETGLTLIDLRRS